LQSSLHNLKGWFHGTFPCHLFNWKFSICMVQLLQSLLINHLYDCLLNDHAVSFINLVCW
jgi:hypothetical protein